MAKEIGIAKVVKGQMTAAGPEGNRGLQEGSPVFKGDTISTAKGAAGSIEFLDKTVLNVGEASKVNLNNYVYDADKGTGQALFKMAQGTFRTVTGEIVKHNPESFKMQSPLATIGIRGTETGHTIPAGGGGENHLVMVFDGKPVIVQPLGGGAFQVLSQAGVKVEVGKFGAGPVLVMTPQEFKYFNALTTTGIQQQGAPTDTISTGQNAAQTIVNSAKDVSAKAAADAAAKAAAETAAKAAAEAAAKAAAEAEQSGDPAAKAAAEAAAKAAAEAAAKAAIEAKAAAELAAKAAAEAAAALQAQALAEAAAKAAADLAAQQGQQQLGQQVQQTLLVTPSVFQTMQDTNPSGPTGPSGQGPVVNLPSPVVVTPPPVIVAPIEPPAPPPQVVTPVVVTQTLLSLAGELAPSGQFVDLAPLLSPSTGSALRDTALPYHETNTNHTQLAATGVSRIDSTVVEVIGSDYNDVILGNTSANLLLGGLGNDTLDGRSGDDLLYGGAGNDSILGGTGSDTIYGGLGNDTISGGDNGDLIYSGAGNDSIDGGGGDDDFALETYLTSADTINGGDGSDWLFFTPDAANPDALQNVTSVEHIVLGDPTTDVTLNVPGTIAIGNTLTFDASALTHSLTLATSTKIDFTAGSGADNITGSSYDDYFHYGTHLTSADTIYGGSGSNTLEFTQVDQGGAETHDLDNVNKVDHIVLGDAVTSLTPTANLHPNVSGAAALSVNASALTHDFTWDGQFLDSGFVTAVNITLGSTGTQTIDGGFNKAISYNVTATNHTMTSADHIYANLYGGVGGILTLGALGGTDALDDVAGFSEISFNQSASVDAVDTLASLSPDGYLLVNGSSLSPTETLRFNGAAITDASLNITGGEGADTLIGGGGNDRITGGKGADALNGGAGNNTFVFNAGDVVSGESIVNTGGATGSIIETYGDVDLSLMSSLQLEGSKSLAINDDDAIVTIKAADISGDSWQLVSNDSNQTLVVNGTSGADTINLGQFDIDSWSETVEINGLAGNDTITGTSGNDLISGGDGADVIAGGGGDDTMYGGTDDCDTSTNDTVTYAADSNGDGMEIHVTNTEVTVTDTFGGIDMVSGFEHAILSQDDDAVYIDGDTPFGDFMSVDFGVGTDSLVVTVDGVDLSENAQDQAMTYTNLEKLVLDSTANDTSASFSAIQVSGEAWAVEAQGNNLHTINIQGTDAGDTIDLAGFTNVANWGSLNANDAINVSGGAGADAITGTQMADNITTLGGNDTIHGSDGNDNIDGGGGINTLNYSAFDSDHPLSVNVSAGRQGTASFGGFTQSFTNIDAFKGSAGADDFVLGENLSSAVTIDGGDGTDTLYFAQNQVGDHTGDLNNVSGVETISLDDADSASLTITETVAQTLVGSLDTKTLIIDASNLSGALSFDASGVTSSDLRFDIASGSGDDTISGGAGDDTIDGGSGWNVIKGSLGNDEIHGNSETDTLDYSAFSTPMSVIYNNIYGGTVTFGGNTQTFERIATIKGGMGDDTVDMSQANGGGGFNGSAGGNDVITGSANEDILSYEGLASALTVNVTGVAAGNAVFDGNTQTFTGVENVTGGGGANTFNIAADTHEPGDQSGASFTINGGAGDSTFNLTAEQTYASVYGGGLILNGGDGNNTFHMGEHLYDAITIDAGASQGFNTLDATVNSDIPVALNNVYGMDTITLSISDSSIDFETLNSGLGHGDNVLNFDVRNFGAANMSLDASQLSTAGGMAFLAGGLKGGQNELGAYNVIGSDAGDTFRFYEHLTIADSINGGGGIDTLHFTQQVQTDNAQVGDLGNVTGVEIIKLGDASTRLDLSADSQCDDLATGLATDYLTLDASDLTGNNTFDLTISGTAANASYLIMGGAGNDTIEGGNGDDTISGGAGNDTIVGGTGNDSLSGGDGDDHFFMDTGANSSGTLDANDTIDGGDGDDTIDYARPATGYSPQDWDNVTNVEHINVLGGQSVTITAAASLCTTGNSLEIDARELMEATITFNGDLATGNLTLYGSVNGNVLHGGSGDDTITGGLLGNDALHGGGGNDVLYGQGGDDTLVGGPGDDELHGGDGSDMASYGYLNSVSNTVTSVTADLDTSVNGYGTVNVQAGPDGGTTLLYDMERFWGSNHATSVTLGATTTAVTLGTGDDTVYGGSVLSTGMTLVGGNYDDDHLYFTTNGSADQLAHVTGFEHIHIDSTPASTTITLADSYLFYYGIGDNAGNTVYVNMTDVNSTNTLTFDASASAYGYLYITGGEGGDLLKGTNYDPFDGVGGNTLYGMGGNDTLLGGSANDHLIGGAGADSMDGGGGNNTFVFSSSSDIIGDSIDSNDGITTLVAQANTDFTQANYVALYGSSEANLILSNGVTATLGHTPVTSMGLQLTDLTVTNDTGATGHLLFQGTTGDDTFDISHVVLDLLTNAGSTVHLDGHGTDTGDTFDGYSLVDDFTFDNITRELFDTTTPLAGHFTFSTDFNHFIGGSGNNLFIASSAVETFEGGDCASATVDYSNSTEGVSVDLSTAIDGIQVVSGYSTGDTLIGIQNVIGSSFGDALTGDSSDNVLTGGAGNDAFHTSEGNDVYHGGDGIDTLFHDMADTPSIDIIGTTDLAGSMTFHFGGIDHNQSFDGIETFQCGPGSDTVDLSAWTTGANIFGNGGDDTVTGGSGCDSIFGGSGNDWLVGGGGADTLNGGSEADTFAYTSISDGHTTAINGTPTALSLLGDTILDFTHLEDKIDLWSMSFDLGGNTTMSGGYDIFFLNTEYDGTNLNAGDCSQWDAKAPSIIVDTVGTSHHIIYDANGSDDGYTLLATTQAGSTLTDADFHLSSP